jgi:hypothetical protein
MYELLYSFSQPDLTIPLTAVLSMFVTSGRRDRMAVGFTTTCAIRIYHLKLVSSNPAHSEVYSIQHYVI